MRSKAVVALMGLLISPAAMAQVGKGTELWDWSKPSRHHSAVVKVQVETPGTNGAKASGSGVVVRFERVSPLPAGEAYCLTAAHVLETMFAKAEPKQGAPDSTTPTKSDASKQDGSKPKEGETKPAPKPETSSVVVGPTPLISVYYRSGEVSRKCKLIAIDEKRDVALLRVALPRGTKPVRVAKNGIKRGEALEFAGFGGGSDVKKPRHFHAFASAPTTKDLIYADTPLLPGDSGGAVFNEDKEVVGVISGGWIWWQGGVRNQVGQRVPATWPARACNVQPIQQLRRTRKANRRR